MLLKEKKRFDYYAFGSPMPGRQFNSGNYRFGFNGMEKDDELKGNGNSYTSMHRAYDPRLGKWLSIDPEVESYPEVSPYLSMDNNPLTKVDPDGDDWFDALAGAAIGIATNLMPAGGSTVRDNYKPNNATDYNNTLKGIDNAFLVGGMGAMLLGGNEMATGTSMAVAGAPIAGVGSAPGLIVATKGAFITGVGFIMAFSANQNKKAGYEYGKAKQKVSSESDTKKVAPNGGNAKPHGSKQHNDAIDDKISELKQNKNVSNIRKNQQQVDVNGNNVGKNRPDVQYDLQIGKKKTHYNQEYDSKSKNSIRHGEVIKKNDPNSKVKLNVLDKKL